AGLVIAETITNPLCGVPDIEAIGAAARERGVPFLVDNTFATPLLARPLDLGATAVMHSATKYLGGHSDLVAGVIVGDARTMGVARARSARTGTPLGPFDAWLALRGLSPQERAELGVGPGTVRVSVGIEDSSDIVADFAQALAV